MIKGETRSAIDMLVDIFKGYEGKLTNIDDEQKEMEKAAANKK